MKKELGLFTLLLSLFTLVSAQTTSLASGLSKGMSQLLSAVEGLLGPLFMAILGGDSGLLFEKTIFLILIFCIVYLVTKSIPVFPNKGAILWIVSISISLLATRFMSGDLLRTALLPYGALGVTLTAGLPLIIFFVFIENLNGSQYKLLRKILWISYIIVFCVIWSTRYESIGTISYIYLGSAIVALIFLFADGAIQRMRIKQKYSESDKNEAHEIIARKRDRIAQLEEWKENEHIDKDVADRKITNIRKQIDKIHKRIS